MNDAAASGPVPMIACHECGTVQHMRALPEGGAAGCARCGATLYRQRRDNIEHTLLLTLAALILFVIANTFPFLTFELEGNADTSTLLSGVRGLYQQGMWPLAVLVLLTATVVPLAWLLSTAYVLLPLWLGRVPWGVAQVFRFTELLRPWAMMEVYLLGVIVAYVKLSDLARLELGIALFAFVGLIVVMIAAEAALEPHEIWRRLGPRPRPDSFVAAARAPGQLSHCDQLALMPPLPARATAHCPRCGAALHRRKPNSLARTWALVLTAAIMYVPANVLPVMTVVHFGRGEPDTILSGVKQLIGAGMWPVALLVFFASITVPVLKLIGLTFLLITTQRRSRWRLRDRSLMYRIIEQVGRWSMVDIFMISILVALVNLGSLATIEPGVGAICFAAVVIITMFASMSFDPRLIWDAEESGHAQDPSALDRGELPEVEVKKRRGISLVWLIPLVAGAIAIWLAYTTLQEKGPQITVVFDNAEGLEAGKTQVKYRNVEVGLVDRVRLSDDLSHIVVTAEPRQEHGRAHEGGHAVLDRPATGRVRRRLGPRHLAVRRLRRVRPRGRSAGARIRRPGGAAANHLTGARDPVRPEHGPPGRDRPRRARLLPRHPRRSGTRLRAGGGQ